MDTEIVANELQVIPINTVKLNPLDIAKLFTKFNHQSDWILGLFRMIYKDWDKIEDIDGFPICTEFTNKWIFTLAIPFDQLNHPDVMNGGAWMNNGFSTIDSKGLEDFEIKLAPYTLMRTE